MQKQYFIDQQRGGLWSCPDYYQIAKTCEDAAEIREDSNIQPVEIGNADADQHSLGVFQSRLLSGEARWSLSDIKGAARRSKPHYMRSRDTLVSRMEAAGHTCEIVKVFTLTHRWQLVLLVDGCAVSRLD
jgi:hypothetical protein